MNEELSLLFVIGGIMTSISIVFLLVALNGFIQYGRREEDYPPEQKLDNGLTAYDEMNKPRKLMRKEVLQKNLPFKGERYLDPNTIQEMEKLIGTKMEGYITEEHFWSEMGKLLFKRYL